MSPPEEKVYTRPLLDKLGVRPDSRVLFVGDLGNDFGDLVRTRTQLVEERTTRESVDLVFLAADSIDDLAALADLRHLIVSNGAVWIVSRKGRAATVRDTDVIAAALDAGLVDNKVVSFSDTHTALRAVIRLRDR